MRLWEEKNDEKVKKRKLTEKERTGENFKRDMFRF